MAGDPNIVTPGSTSTPSTIVSGQNDVSAADLPSMSLNRTLPRQVSTGTTRGTQSNTGENIVQDPQTNNTVINNSGINQNTVYSDPTTNTPQVVIGKLPDNNYGMKVAQPGVNVLTATDNQLIFNSEQDVFKIAFKEMGNIPSWTTANGTTNASLLTVPHGLSTTPIVNIYAQAALLNVNVQLIASAYVPLPISGSASTIAWYLFPDINNSYYLVDVSFAVDSTNIYVQAAYHNNSGASVTLQAIPVTIFAFQETATSVV